MLESASWGDGVSALGGVWSRGCLLWGGVVVSVPGGVSAPGGSALGGVCPGGGVVYSGGGWGGVCSGGGLSQHALRQTPLWTEWMTDRCKNITLATTSLRPVIIGWRPWGTSFLYFWYGVKYTAVIGLPCSLAAGTESTHSPDCSRTCSVLLSDPWRGRLPSYLRTVPLQKKNKWKK